MEIDADIVFERTIDELPNEIFYMIFELLDCKSLLNCTLVCHKWLDLINNSGRILQNIPLTILDSTCYFEFIQSRSTLLRQHKKVSLNRALFSVLSPNLAKVCHDADEISFNDVSFDNSSIFESIIRACGNLKYLELDTPMICNPEKKSSSSDGCGESNIYYSIDELDLILRDDDDVSWEVLKTFDTIPSVVHRLYLYLDLELEFHLLGDMFTYINQHYQKSLKKLKISKWNTNGSFVAPKAMEHLNQMDSLQLELLSIDEPVDNDLFSQFVQQQRKIQVLEMGNFTEQQLSDVIKFAELRELFLKIRHNNKLYEIDAKMPLLPKLKKITFALHDQQIDRVEWSFLGKLTELESFSLDDKNENRPILRLTEIGGPLQALKELYLGNMTIEYDTLQTILKFMPNLELLVLFSIFGIETNGLLGNKKPDDYSISNLQRLKFLAVDSYAINDEVLIAMKLPLLKHVELYGYIVTYTNKGLNSLRNKCPLLEYVITSNDKINLASIETVDDGEM